MGDKRVTRKRSLARLDKMAAKTRGNVAKQSGLPKKTASPAQGKRPVSSKD